MDIGSGTGVLAFLACRRGARRVFAIEAGDVVQVAREIAAANGFGERIEFIQEVSTQVDLPVRADVVISEIGGSLPWFASHLPSIIDARQRFLARGGILVPRCDDVWGAVVEAEALYRGPWSDDPCQRRIERLEASAVSQELGVLRDRVRARHVRSTSPTSTALEHR